MESLPKETTMNAMLRIAVVFDGHDVTIYRDDEDYCSDQVPEYPSPRQQRTFALPEDPKYACIGPFIGEIEEVYLYDKALTSEEVSLLESNSDSGPAPVACFDFEDGSVSDKCGHFEDFDIFGNVKFVSVAKIEFFVNDAPMPLNYSRLGR